MGNVLLRPATLLYFKPDQGIAGDAHPFYYNYICYLYYLDQQFDSCLLTSSDHFYWRPKALTHTRPTSDYPFPLPSFVPGIWYHEKDQFFHREKSPDPEEYQMLKPDFYFGVGIENTWLAEFPPNIRPGKRLLDEYLHMGHYDQWEHDLTLAKSLGINAIRYSVPWYLSNPKPGKYDWSWISKPVEWLVARQIIPIMDLLHYGTPLWMDNGFLNPDFPDYFNEYVSEFARQFTGLLDHYTPVNEPQTTLLLSGYLAEWPPYLSGLEGWIKLALPLARAMVKASGALRVNLPGVILISADCHNNPGWKPFCDVCGIDSKDESSELLFEYFPASLAYGKIEPNSMMWHCLVQLGVPEKELAWFQENAQLPDIFGCNFYPVGGIEPTTDLHENLDRLILRCRRICRKFQIPVYITETSSGPGDAEKIAWIDHLYEAFTKLHSEGMPLKGINWWFLYSTVSWDYRNSEKTFKECLDRADWIFNQGLYSIQLHPDGELARIPTNAASYFPGLYARIRHELSSAFSIG